MILRKELTFTVYASSVSSKHVDIGSLIFWCLMMKIRFMKRKKIENFLK